MDPLEKSGLQLLDRLEPALYLAQWKTVDDALQVMHVNGLSSGLGRVTTLSFVDLFGLALEANPPKGVKVALDVGRTINPLSPAETETYLRDVDTVFEPTCTLTDPPGSEPVNAWFAPVLAGEFRADVLTPCWTMHRRVAR